MNIPRRHQQKYPSTHASLLTPTWHTPRNPRTIFRNTSKKIWALSIGTLLAFFVPLLVYASMYKPEQNPANSLHTNEQKNSPTAQTSLNTATDTQHQITNTGSASQQTSLSVNGQSVPVPKHGTYTEVLTDSNGTTSVMVTSDSNQSVSNNSSSSNSSIDVQVDSHKESGRR